MLADPPIGHYVKIIELCRVPMGGSEYQDEGAQESEEAGEQESQAVNEQENKLKDKSIR